MPSKKRSDTGENSSQKSARSTRTGSPIVGIGASAGGLEAYTQLLRHLPTDTGMGFVLVQHLDPQHESALASLLAKATLLPVREVTDDLSVEPDNIYVIPPNTSLTIANGVLKLQPRQRTDGAHRSIDIFFESLAQDQRERAIGVLVLRTRGRAPVYDYQRPTLRLRMAGSSLDRR
jgi:two-component system, chemotaxis family, CheB/CheR fusion protein